MSDINKISQEIKNYAVDLGFSKVGFAEANRCFSEADRFSAWIGRKYYGDLSWLARSVGIRLDPGRVLPGVKTVLSVAVNYFNDAVNPEEKGIGRFSRYVWGSDYHKVVSERLDGLFSFIKKNIPSVQGKVCVDSHPVMEKYWAQLSGIGWRGKHTIVINQEYGSWIFLGEILLTERFEYDTPEIDRCGSCNICIEACPTKAIVEPYVLNTRRCISYMTIEHKAEFSEEMKKDLGEWLYGCDVCQDVCPWNKKQSRQTHIKDFLVRKEMLASKSSAILGMSEDEFSIIFNDNPVRRSGYHRLQRNARAVKDNFKILR